MFYEFTDPGLTFSEMGGEVYSQEMLGDLLPQYYKRLFPFAQYTKLDFLIFLLINNQ